MTGTTKNALLSELRKKKLITGSSTSSKTKSVGAIPVVQDKTLQTWIKGITNQLQEIDKSFVRSKDLAKTGLVDVDGNGNISLPKPEDNSTIVPKAVEELKATGAYSTVTLDWKTPKSKFFGRNEVYRSEKNDFGTAVNIGSSTGDVYTDYVGNNSKAYYWVRTISKAGVQGALSSSVYAETSIDIDYLLENLSEQISEGLLSQSIKDQLAGIDKNAEYIKSVEAQVQDKIAEVKDIIGRDIIESKLSVSQHLNDAQIRMSEAEIRIEDYKKYSESIVDAAKKLALEADLDLQKYIKDVQQYANDQVALLSNSVNEVRKQAELAQQTADNEIIERKVQVDEAITKASNMIDAAKVEMGNQTNVLIDEKLVPIKTQNETAIRDIKNLGTQYINLDKKIDAGILNEATIRSDKDDALSHRMDVQFAEFTSELTKAKSTILSESETRANENQALTLQINNATSEIGKNKSSISEVRQTLSDFQTSTASKFDSIESGITTNNGKIQGQIAEVEKSVSSLEGTTNTKFSNLSSSLKETDDIAKTAINNAAKAQETATTAVNKADANSQKILTISAKTSGLNNAIQATATADFLNEWKITSGANELRLIDEPTARGGKVLRAGNNNGNDTIWAHWNAFIPFDENKTYAIKYRYRRVNGNGGVYVGLAVKDSTQASFVNIADKLDTTLGSSHYAEVNAMPALGDFVTGISYFKGRELAGVNVGYGKSPLQNPRKLPSKAAFISVMFIANYNAFAGEVDIDYIDLVDAEAAVIGFNAEAKATDLFKTASTATQTVADRSTLLETQMRDAQGKIESNSLALNKTATKSELDAAMGQVATNINAAINGLTLGGVNAVANSEAPRTSTAASNKEYLMYERSAELKAFYDENLNKQITISFEMSVPVVGPVQVYSSNASAHTFSVTVNVVIPNEWIKYIVTVIPKPHTSSTTVSTIEFYGTYGSGRIPTIRKLQIEAGNKATAWSPSPRDFNALIDAQAQAIKETNAEVKKQGDTISSQGVDLTKLKNDLITTNQEVSKRATTEALNITNSKVEDQQGKLKAVTEQATALSASLKRVAAAGANLLIQSNVVGTYNGSSYPHHRYKLGEDWEVGATYTLMWCAEHQRNNTDTSSSLSVYAGGGQQVLQSVVNTNGKVINKITFVKNSQGLEQRVLNFYMINRPSAAQGSIGTVYWAVLVKGDLITTESWIPSAYDYNVAVDQVNANFNDFKQTYVTDKEALTKRTSSLETGLSNAEKNIDNTAKALQNYATNAKLDEVTASQTNQLNAEIKKVKGSIDSASDSNSLLPDFNLKNPEDWINYYNYDLSQHFKKTTTGKVGNTVFRKDTSNQAGCWVNSRKALPTNRPYKVSFWVRRSADSTGTCNITAMYGKADGIFSNAAITAVYIDTNKIPADEQWVLIEQVVNFNLHPQVKLGFSIGHNATGGWWELQGFSVENVVTEKDVDSTLVRATQLQSYSTKVDTTKAVATATDAMESKFKQKFGNLWTDSTATLDSTRYTKSETDRAIADESKTLKAALSLSGGDNIIKNGDFSKPLDGTNWRQNEVIAGNTFEIFKDANGATYGRFASSNTTTMFKGVVEQITLADGLELDQTYTLSFKAKSLTAAQISLLLIIHRYDGSSNNQLHSSWQLYTDKETICTYTFKTNVANLRSINIILYAPTGIAPDFLIREVQIEKGELATGFRVNPRELIDAIQYAEDNWILANDEPKSVSITTGTNRTVAVWDLMYRHKDLPINKGDPIVVRLKYTADSGLIGAACIPQFHGGTYSIGVNSFIVAASGEVELKGIFPSDLKATAFDFVPLGLRFDNAPAGGVFTVTNAFISRGNSAPNFKGGFKSVLKQNAQFVEDTFVRAEANKQVIAQQIQQYDASIPEGMATVVKSTKVTADNAAKDLASFKSVDFKQLQNSTNNLGTALESTTMLAMMITNGKLLYGDVNFKKGMNNVGTYNNLGNGTVSVTREAKSADNPTTSTHELRIVTTGSASPNFGGFHQQFFTRSNAIFIIKYLIKLPIGYKLYPAANLMGDGSVDKFIGSTDGTGRFEVYVRMVKSGTTGRFDTSGFVHVAGGPAPTPASPLIWTLGQIECYDVTDYASADPNLQDFVSTATESLGTLTNFKETWASKLTEMSSKLDRTNSAYILNSDLTNTNIERAIAASSNHLKSEYIDPLQKNTESLKENILTNVDLSGLNPDIYYPVIFQLATGKQKYDFKVFCTLGGQNNSNVPWATHGTRSFGLNCEWSVTANGWGTQAESRIIEKFSYSWTPQSPLINIRQMSNASIEVVFLRGGARYDISHYKTITPLIKTEFFTALGQSIEPIQYNSSLVPVPIFAEIVKAQDVAGAAARSVADIQRDYITSSKLNEAFASTTERMSALYSANSQSIMTSAQTTFEKDWINRTPSGSRIGMRLIEDQTCRGGFAIRMGDNSGNDEVWLNWFATLPIDENKMYRIKYRYRRVSGAGVVYVGATCFNAAKTAFITDSNYINGDIGSSHYVVGGAAPALGTWVTGVAYFKGRSAGASSGAGTLTNPKTFANKAAFFTPVFIGNYSAQAGEVDLDFIDIEDADNLADLETFKTTYASDKTAYTSVIDTLTSTFGDKAIGLTEQKKFVDGVKGVATFLINNNGIATGWGTTSELVNGQVKTEFGVYSSRFFVASDTNAKTFPFIVDGNNVIMNTAIIKDGSIQSAKIGNLGADKITSGDIAADRMKANIVEAARGQFQSLSSITATIGHLRTSETGARIEIADQFIKSFDNNGVKRVQIGNLEL